MRRCESFSGAGNLSEEGGVVLVRYGAVQKYNSFQVGVCTDTLINILALSSQVIQNHQRSVL